MGKCPIWHAKLWPQAKRLARAKGKQKTTACSACGTLNHRKDSQKCPKYEPKPAKKKLPTWVPPYFRRRSSSRSRTSTSSSTSSSTSTKTSTSISSSSSSSRTSSSGSSSSSSSSSSCCCCCRRLYIRLEANPEYYNQEWPLQPCKPQTLDCPELEPGAKKNPKPSQVLQELELSHGIHACPRPG